MWGVAPDDATRREPCFGNGIVSGLTQTPYDLLRIGAWALVIVGALFVVTGLIRYWGAQARR